MRARIAWVVLLLVAVLPGYAAAQPAMPVACDTNAQSLGTEPGTEAMVTCPPGCPAAAIWGSGVYSDDSSVCTAAVHAGVLPAFAGGQLRVVIAPGLATYASTAQNGITSSPWGVWTRSFFVVAGATATPPPTGGTYAVTFGCASCWVGLFTPESYAAASTRAATCHPHPEWYTDTPASALHSLMWVRPMDPCLATVWSPRQGMQTDRVPAGHYIAVGVRDGYRAVAPIDVTTDTRVDLEPRLEFFDCGFSCPIVYVQSGGDMVRVSEVLTDLASADLEATQALVLPIPDRADGQVTVRIAEEEPERSFLDRAVLRADGRELQPSLCSAEPTHALCSDDGIFQTLDLDEHLDLVFDVTDVPVGTPLEIAVNGYYIPLGVAAAHP